MNRLHPNTDATDERERAGGPSGDYGDWNSHSALSGHAITDERHKAF